MELKEWQKILLFIRKDVCLTIIIIAATIALLVTLYETPNAAGVVVSMAQTMQKIVK